MESSVLDALDTIMNADEVDRRLDELSNIDKDDFYTNGELDLAKAKRRNKLHLIRAVKFNRSGRILDIDLCNDNSGFIYLIRAANGLVKIGRSVNVQKRFEVLNSTSPIPLELLEFWPVDDAVSVEAKLHDRYVDKRIRGEWFALDENDIADIANKFAS